MKTVNELLDQRGQIIESMKALQKASPDGLSTENQTAYDKMDADQESLKARADELHKLETISAESSTFEPTAIATPEQGYGDALHAYLKGAGISNALQVGTDSEGGYRVSDEFNMTFREIRDDVNALRPFVEVITTKGDHNIRVESTAATATWTAEEAAYTESDPAFGNVIMQAHKLGVITKVSEELVQDDDFGVEAYLAKAFARAIAVAEETAFIAGTDSNQPNGIINGAGDVGSTETAITADALLDLYYGLNRVYRDNATWILHDSTVRLIRALGESASTDDFIWQPGLQADQPDRILGRPYVVSAAMPETTDSPNAVVGVFGDLKNYCVADRTGLSVQRLNELYASTGQVGFKGSVRVDGETTQAAGIKSLTLA